MTPIQHVFFDRVTPFSAMEFPVRFRLKAHTEDAQLELPALP
jgi:hypothetical protein